MVLSATFRVTEESSAIILLFLYNTKFFILFIPYAQVVKVINYEQYFLLTVTPHRISITEINLQQHLSLLYNALGDIESSDLIFADKVISIFTPKLLFVCVMTLGCFYEERIIKKYKNRHN